MSKLAPLVFAVVLSGCTTMLPAAAPAVAPVTPFDLLHHGVYAGGGSSALKGQAFLRQQGGGVVTCAGSDVFLFPDTPYFRESLELARAGRQLQQAPIDAQAVVRRAQCDAQGNFEFHSLPAANWIVATQVKWAVGYNQQGGGLVKNVTLTNGHTTQLLLTDADFYAR